MTAQTVSNAVARRESGPVTIMWSRRTHFRAVLPQQVDVEAFLGTAAGALYSNADLMAAAERSPDSLITALMRCASLGHLPGTDEFYLVPRKKKGVPEVQGIEGYRGIVERMYRSGAVASVVVREVCEKDDFEYVEGIHDKPVHNVKWFGGGRGQMIGVYAYAVLTTGAVSRVVILDRDDVLAAREASDSKNSDYSPWNRADGGKDHPEFTGRSMWWKTAARRLEPWVPTSAEYRREQLRAAAEASAIAGNIPPAPPEHHAPAAEPDDIHDAEIIDEPEADQPKREPAARAKLRQLLAQMPWENTGDATVFLAWQTGGQADLDKLTSPEVRLVTTYLDDLLGNAQGDLETAMSRLWQQYRESQAPDD